jgi:uncharacterized membrane protein SirB2
VSAALANGGLFLARGALLFAGARSRSWALAGPVRYLGYTIDTVLVTAALMLTNIVEQHPFVHAWVTVKLALLGVYIALGAIAFRKSSPARLRLGLWLAGLAIFAFIYSVARAHDPLGFLGRFARP